MSRKKITEESAKLGIDFAWRSHSAITDWTARVDAKASILLSLGGVLTAVLVNLSTGDRLLTGLEGWRIIVARAGIGALAFGVLISALVVAPRLKRRQSRRIWKSNFIYFGHLRHWNPKDLKRKLQELDSETELEVLSAQLVTTSKIAWQKHSRLQFAIALMIIGVVLVFASSAWPR